MKTGLVLLASYFILAPMFVFLLIFYQLFLVANQASLLAKAAQPIVTNEATPHVYQEVLTPELAIELRISVLKKFFARYNSPLEAHANEIVQAANKYGLDWRLLPAIAMQESTLCLKAPKDTNNCWGFGIYGNKKTTFPDLSAAIETVSKTLARDYHERGLVEPYDIMTRYTPTNSGEWAENVSYVMGRISPTL